MDIYFNSQLYLIQFQIEKSYFFYFPLFGKYGKVIILIVNFLNAHNSGSSLLIIHKYNRKYSIT